MKNVTTGSVGEARSFDEGDEVYVLFGPKYVHGRIVEDRGHIGVGGRQLLRVAIDPASSDEEPVYIELPISDLFTSPPVDSEQLAG